MSDESDRKDYQDYLDYQKHMAEGFQTHGTRHPQPGDEEYETSNAKEQANQEALPSRVGSALPLAAGIATGGAGLGYSVPAVTAASIAGQKLQGNEVSPGQTALDVGLNSVVPAGISKLGSMLGKGGDYLMQRAVGMKKYIPGLGKDLAGEGLIGTRNQLADQVQAKMAERGAQIGELSSSLKDVPTDTASQHILGRASKLVQSDGFIDPADQTKYQALQDLADKVSERGGPEGSVSGKIASESRAGAGVRAREAGAYRDNPAETMKARGASAEQQGWSQALKEAYAKAHPEEANKLAEADQSYSTLAKANKPLSANQSMAQTPYSTKIMSIPGTSLGSSIGGRAAISLEDLLSKPQVRNSPGLLQMLTPRDGEK